ncbi:MAG: hypothetical protein QM741_11345 [Rudaea sp.]|uniref:hypothetical protein n=1 Tax=Rudaea sp. TaxID=2136325 RepID=UPI0039E2EC89
MTNNSPKSFVLATSLAMVAGIAFAQEKPADGYPVHSPAEVMELAAQKAGGDVRATVTFTIRKAGTGKKNSYGHFFLDSMEDFRDPRSLNVNVFPHAARKLGLHEGDPLVGKSLTVQGTARRVLIRCHTGCPQDASLDHYYQTQLIVREGNDLTIDKARDEPDRAPAEN